MSKDASTYRGQHLLGYKILVEVDETEEVSKGGIILTDKKAQDQASIVAKVLAKSHAAFKDEDRWPEGTHIPGVGDWVVFMSYAGKCIEFTDDDGDKKRDIRFISDTDVFMWSKHKPAVRRPANF